MSIAIVFGSSMGNTESAANTINEKLGLDAQVINVADASPADLNKFDKLICGTSTWGSGDLQDDWDAFDFDGLELSGKTMAVFGLGDSASYGDEFCNAMGKLYKIFKSKGANLVGKTSTSGYNFESSESVEGDNFVGLALDYDNEEDLSETRIEKWVEIIKPDFE